jgi:hypothetical protein
MTSQRRSLTLLEVLIAAVLAGGLFAVLFKSWIQLESAASAAHRSAQRICSDYSTRLWIQDHLSGAIVRGERPAISWDGDALEASCVHGSHQDPRLAGPVKLRLLVQSGALMAWLESDEELWQSGALRQQKILWEDVRSLQFAAFGQLDQESQPSWHQGHQIWPSPPLFAELRVERSDGWIALPIFFIGDES